MSRNSTTLRRRASSLRPPTPEDLSRLDRLAREKDVDTSDLPSGAGQLPPSAGPIRAAILREINRLRLSPYRLWKMAQLRNPKISASQVYEYLKGDRNLTSEALESLVEAAGLRIAPSASANRKIAGSTSKAATKHRAGRGRTVAAR